MLKYKLLLFILAGFLVSKAQEFNYNYTFFTNGNMLTDYFYSQTSSGNGSFINNHHHKLPVTENIFHTPGNALHFKYTNAKGGRWQAIVYHPVIRGQDHFKRAEYLSFWLYIPGTINPEHLPAIRFMKNDSSLTNLLSVNSAEINKWYQVTIPTAMINNFNSNRPDDLIGIVFSQQSDDNKQHEIYVDDIEFISSDTSPSILNPPTLNSASGYARHIDITWNGTDDKPIRLVKIYRSENGIDFKPVAVQQPYINRYADYTGKTGKKYFYKVSFLNDNYEESGLSNRIHASTRPMTDNELLTMVQQACFRYYWEAAEPNSGLALENIHGRHDMVAAGASGFGIMALIVGTERKFISRKDAVERFLKIVNYLNRAETFHGAYPHFINGPTGKVEPFFGMKDDGADLVETSFLLQGLLAAREYFSGNDLAEKTIRDGIESIWEKVEWSWFRQRADSKFLYWHWSPDQGWIINHTLIGWNETMVTYLLAIASPTFPVGAAMYYTGWANQDSIGQKYRLWGHTKDGTMYTNGNNYFGIKLDVGVSNGGPLFFTHYSYMGYDPHHITDKYTNYFFNNRNITRINYRYCVLNPKKYKGYGESAWGLTASDGPYDYTADEPVPFQDHGKITPTGAVSSFPYTPVESKRALKNYYYHYGKFLWGEYGFKDAFDLNNNWCSDIYMGLNQAPMVVMIENYRSGLIWNLFMRNNDIKKGLEKLEAQTKKMMK